jgi:hypothetical protein
MRLRGTHQNFPKCEEIARPSKMREKKNKEFF